MKKNKDQIHGAVKSSWSESLAIQLACRLQHWQNSWAIWMGLRFNSLAPGMKKVLIAIVLTLMASISTCQILGFSLLAERNRSPIPLTQTTPSRPVPSDSLLLMESIYTKNK